MMIDFSPPQATVESPVQGVLQVLVVSGGVKSPQKHSVPRTDDVMENTTRSTCLGGRKQHQNVSTSS